MKFSDKLQKIRKENNITQEGLADRLDVSRQAVSKWESGQAYPDTEKLIQLSKIFNVSLDELINDEKKIEDNVISNKRINITEIFNIVFTFFSNLVSMFFAMKFKDKIKFLFELAILILCIWFASVISTNIICEIVRRLFSFLPFKLVNGLVYVIDTLLYILWIILGGIIVVKVLKTRYLDYYVIITDDTVDKTKLEEPIKELKEKKEYKVVIRDPGHSSSSIFKKIGKLFLLALKVLGLLILIPAVNCFIIFVVLAVISLSFITSGLFFNGITISLIGVLLFIYLVIEFILKLVFDRSLNFKAMFIIFIISISLMGIGGGLSLTSLGDFEIYENEKVENKIIEKTINMSDNLIFMEIMDIPNDSFVIDDNRSDIKLEVETAGNVDVYTHSFDNYKMVVFSAYDAKNEFDTFKEIIADVKNKRIRDDYGNNYQFEVVKVYISQANLDKLRKNYDNYIEIYD